MTRAEIIDLYQGYIACLNRQDWGRLGHYVADQVQHNGAGIGLHGYHAMLVADFRAIPDLSFHITRLICDPPMIAASLAFDCTPKGMLFGLAVNGTRVQFTENVFYQIAEGKIQKVWSVIDTAAIAARI